MSQNLVELIKRHGGIEEQTVVERLAAAVEADGTLSVERVRAVAKESGVPEASVHGIATFYDDLIGARGRRHVRVCSGTACYAATRDSHIDQLSAGLGLGLGEVDELGEHSLGETVCLGFCHSAPAVRVGDTIDAGPGVIERAIAGTAVQAAEPEPRSILDGPGILATEPWQGFKRVLREWTPEKLLEEVLAAGLTGRGGAAFPTGRKWEFARNAAGSEKVIVCNGDEGDPGSYIDKVLMEERPGLLLEGLALAGYAVGANHGFVLVRSEYPRSKPALEAAVAAARADGTLGRDLMGTGFDFDVTIVEGAGSYVVGEETALLACLEGLRGTVSARPPFPAERGYRDFPTVVNNVETLCNAPVIATLGAEQYRSLSPTDSAGSKLVCFNERFANPGVVEVPFGLTVRRLCDEVAGGMVDGHTIKAVQIGGPLGGILPAALLDTPFDFRELEAVGCMVGHGSLVAFDERTDMRDLARHLLRFGAHESCGKCFPCRIGLQRGYEMVLADSPIDRTRLEALLETLELGSLCAHGGGMPAPLRSLIEHYPDELDLV